MAWLGVAWIYLRTILLLEHLAVLIRITLLQQQVLVRLNSSNMSRTVCCFSSATYISCAFVTCLYEAESPSTQTLRFSVVSRDFCWLLEDTTIHRHAGQKVSFLKTTLFSTPLSPQGSLFVILPLPGQQLKIRVFLHIFTN